MKDSTELAFSICITISIMACIILLKPDSIKDEIKSGLHGRSYNVLFVLKPVDKD